MKNILLVVVFTLFAQIVSAQNMVKGKVKDQSGPLPGVSIVVKNTQKGTVTNADGEYRLLVEKGQTLVFSFIGMKTVEKKVGSTSVINVVLKSDDRLLSEVEVIGTGYQKIDRKLFTGSAVRLEMEDIKLDGVADISRGLQGQVAGVEIENASGTFGAAPIIRIRGNASINGTNKPLWVVDGVVLEDAVELTNEDITSGNLSTVLSSSTVGLNPEDVASFEVLKDASATALYGARAMNGVVVVTTRRGQEGKPKVSYTENLTIRERPRYSQFDIMSSGDEMYVYQELYQKGWMDIATANMARHHGALQNMFRQISLGKITWGKDTRLNYDYLQRYADANTDWFKLLFKNSVSSSRSLSISSGTEKAKFRTSVGMLNDRGQTIADKVQNYTAALKGDFSLSKKLDLGFKLSGNVRNQKLAASEDRKFEPIKGVYERNFDINPFNYALYTARSITPYNEKGERQFFRRNWAPFNILHEIEHNRLYLKLSDLTFQTNFNYKISSNLSFNTVMQGRWYQSNAVQEVHENSNNANAYRSENPLLLTANIYLFRDLQNPSLQPYSVLPQGGFRKTTANTLTNYSMRNTFSYSKIFDQKHEVSAIAGQEIRYSDRSKEYFEGWGYFFDKGGLSLPDPDFIRYLDQRDEKYFTINNTRNRSWGVFLNAGYSFNRKYIFNATFRYDGDNRTGKSRQARYLPTWNISGAWNIDREPWAKNISWLNRLKLKSTYGLSGDNPLNASAALVLKAISPLRPDQPDRETGLQIKHLDNEFLTFEKLYEFNIGTEIGLFNNAVSAEFEYYIRKSKDLLGYIETSGVGGAQYKYGNIGEMETKGFELTLKTRNLRKGDFSWFTTVTFSRADNLVTKWQSRNRIADAISRNGASIAGYPRGALFSIPFAGLDANGIPTFKGKNGEGTTQKINLQERENITDYLKYEGSTTPKGYGGFINDFRYKNFSLNIGISFRYGNKIRLDDVYRREYTDDESLPRDLINRWQLPGDEKITNIPAIITRRMERKLDVAGLNPYELYNKSDLRVAKGDFVRLKSVRLRYILPEKLFENIFVEGATFTASAYNLWLLHSDARLNGIDPEFFQSGGISLPMSRSYTFTLNLKF